MQYITSEVTEDYKRVWIQFMAAAMAASSTTQVDAQAKRADAALAEYKKRFGPSLPVRGLPK